MSDPLYKTSALYGAVEMQPVEYWIRQVGEYSYELHCKYSVLSGFSSAKEILQLAVIANLMFISDPNPELAYVPPVRKKRRFWLW